MAFDIQGARAAGYSDDEIADHLATLKGIDVATARKSGWDTPSLMAELSSEWAQKSLPAGVKDSGLGGGRGTVNPPMDGAPRETVRSQPVGGLAAAQMGGRRGTMRTGAAPYVAPDPLITDDPLSNPAPVEMRQPLIEQRGAPVRPEVAEAARAQLAAMPRDQRLAQGQRTDLPAWMRSTVQAANRDISAGDAISPALGVQGRSLEARTARALTQGADMPTARAAALGSALADRPLNLPGARSLTADEIAVADARKEGEAAAGDNPIRAGLYSAGQGVQQAGSGVAAMVLQAFGDEKGAKEFEQAGKVAKARADGAAELQQMRRRAAEIGLIPQGLTDAMGADGAAVLGAANSLGQMLPAMAAGFGTTLVTKNPAAGLDVATSIMGTQVAGQEYIAGREKGLNPGHAALRAATMGATEILFERFGLTPKIIGAFRSASADVPTAELPQKAAAFLQALSRRGVATMAKEVASEEATTVTQYLVDGSPLGLNQPISVGELLGQMRDTAVQTMMLTGMMMAPGAVMNAGRRGDTRGATAQPMSQQPQGAAPQPIIPPQQPGQPQAAQAVDNIVGTLRQAGAIDGQDFTGLDTPAPAAQAGPEMQPEQEAIPVGDATEVIPVGDAMEIDPIPVGQATEMLPTADAAELEPIPAGEATEISPEVIQADDIMAADGEPFTSRTSAAAKAYSAGGGEVVRLPDHFGSGKPGFVVRPIVEARPAGTRGTDARDLPTQQPATAAPVAQPQTPQGGANEVAASQSEIRPMAAGQPVATEQPQRKTKVYKNRGVADAARKAAGNTLKLQKVKGGFVLRPKTDAEIEAEAKSARRLTARKAVDVDRDPLLVAIAKMGGLSPAEKADTIGQGNKLTRGGHVFRASGLPIDTMAEYLAESNYIPPQEMERDGGTTWLRDAIKAEHMGREHFSQRGEGWMADRMAEAERQAQMDAEGDPFGPLSELTPEDLESSGYTQASPEVQALTEQLMADAEAAGIDTEAIRERVAMQTPDGATADEYEAALQAAVRQALAQDRGNAQGSNAGAARTGNKDRGGADGDQEQGASQGLTLKAQTAEDLRAKTEREEAAAQAEKAKREAEQARLKKEAEGRDNRTRADRTVDDFRLGQSAEQQMSGMRDMFADAPAINTPAGRVESQPARAKRDDGRTIPQEGDKVYTEAGGFGGMPAVIRGEVRSGANGLFVAIEGAQGMLGEQAGRKRTPLSADWTLTGEEHPNARQRRESAERVDADAAKRRADRDAALNAAAAKNGTLDPDAVKVGDTLELADGTRGTVTDVESYGIFVDGRSIGNDMRGIKKIKAAADQPQDQPGTTGVVAGGSRPTPATQQEAEPTTGRAVKDSLTPAAAPEESPAATEATPSADQGKKSDRLTDAGEELIRNRRGKLKGLAWDDVSAMNDTLKVAQVVKGNVWPRPDYSKMVEDGAPAWKAAALKAVYDKLAAAPVTRAAPTDADLRAYIETLQQVREALAAELDRVEGIGGAGDLWKTLSARNLFGKVFPIPADARAVYGTPSPFDRVSEQGKENNRRALLIGGNAAVQALQFGYKTTSKIRDLLAEGFPAKQEAWQKSYEVRPAETRDSDVPEAERTGQPQQRFYVYEKGSRWRLAKGGQDGGYATQELAEAFARTLVSRKRETLPPSRGLDLADAKRTGPDWRGGQDVTAEQVMAHFGFRGVNLGEYVKAKQGVAQLHLNYVFDAFSDLADLLGVPPKAMSLNGTLGVAIGAQGSGKALAHFVPGVNEINITRDSGAGALAHEFGHAVDHYFATQHGRAASMAKRPYLSAVVQNIGDAGSVRPEVMAAMRAVMKAINTRQMTEAEARKYLSDQRELQQRRMDRWIKEFSGNKGADPVALAAVGEKLKRGDIGEPLDGDVEANLSEFMRAAGLKPGNAIAANAFAVAYRLRDLSDETRFLANHIPQVDTDYAKASAAMDAKKQGEGYWSTPWEKFARAFETFAMDALKDRERENLYLSGMVDGKGWASWAESTGKATPYPAGAERLELQQAFQSLVDTIQTREDDAGNVAMFSRAPATDTAGQQQPGDIVRADGRPFRTPLGQDAVAAMKAAGAPGTHTFVRLDAGGYVLRKSPSNAEAAAKGSGPGVTPGRQDPRASGASDNRKSWLGPSPRERGNSLSSEQSVAQRNAVVNSPEFKRWFGDSKIVDDNGQPLVVYHGTHGDISEFEPSLAQRGEVGIWLTGLPAYAEWITSVKPSGSDGSSGANVMPVFVSMQNPKVIDILEEGRRVADAIGTELPTDSMEAQRILSTGYGWDSAVSAMRDEAESEGHDGLILQGFDDTYPGGETTAYIAFRPEQVKSAIGNTGAFDPANPDIRMSRGTGRGVAMPDAQRVVAAIREVLPGAPAIQLHARPEDAPAGLLSILRREGAMNDAEAVYWNGEVHAFPSNIADAARLEFVVGRHEVRHYGLDKLLGEGRAPLMRQLYATNAAIRKAADEYIKRFPGADRATAVEEALADMPAAKVESMRLLSRLVAAVRDGLRRLADSIRDKAPRLAAAIEPAAWTDADILALVRRAEDVSRRPAAGTQAANAYAAFARAWHGTPYRGIEKFSTEKIGTGEGAQAFGYGLYFASRRDVADHYRESVSNSRGGGLALAGVVPTSPNEGLSQAGWVAAKNLSKLLVSDTGVVKPFGNLDVESQDRVLAVMRTLLEDNKILNAVVGLVPVDVVNVLGGMQRSAEYLRRYQTVLVHLLPANSNDLVPSSIPAVNVLAHAVALAAAKVHTGLPRFDVLPQDFLTASGALHSDVPEVVARSVPQPSEFAKGQLYEVEIPEDTDMLLWDKPLDQQSDKVRKSLKAVRSALNESGVLDDYLERKNAEWDELTGQDLYEIIKRASLDDALPSNGPGITEAQEEGRDDKAASLFLYNEGLAGIKYLDGTSRDSNGYSHNYVIFSGDDVQIQAAMFSRANGTNRPVPADTNAPGQSGGAQSANSGKGATDKRLTPLEFKRGMSFVREVEALAEKHGAIYIRWSPGSERDLKPGSVSRDFVAGSVHSGLSAVEVRDDTHYTDIATALAEYGFLRMQDRASLPRVYLGMRIGTDSDSQALIRPSAVALEVPADVVALLDKGLAEAIQLQDSIETDRKRLARITDHFGRKITEDAIAKNQAKLELLLNDQPAPASGGAMFSRRPQRDEVTERALAKGGIGQRRGVRQAIANAFGRAMQVLSDRNELLATARQGALDQFSGIQRAVTRDVGNLDANADPYVAARLANGGTSSVMRALLLHGQAKWANNGQHLEKIPGTTGLLDILAPLGEDINDWFGWMIGNRAARLKKEGRENNFTEAEIAALQALATPEKKASFQKAALQYQAFKRSVLDVAQEAGLIDPEARRAWDYADYIPFYRQVDEKAVFSPTGKKGLAGQSSGIRTLKGGAAALNDPIENLLMNFSRLIDASLKNNAIRKTVDMLEQAGSAAVEKVGYDFKSAAVPADQVRKLLLEAGTPEDLVDVIPPEAFAGMAKVWAIQQPADPDVVRVMDGGKPRFYRVNDPLLLRSLTSFVPFDFPGLALMRGAKRWLTNLVTSTPEFIIRNWIRDSVAAQAITRDGFSPGKSLAGIVKSYRESGAAEHMLFAGASFGAGQANANDPEGSAAEMRRALRDRGVPAGMVDGFMASVLDTPMKVWDQWRRVSDAVENANREAVFEAATKAGRTTTEAAYESKDLMDFSLRGGWAGYQILADVLPFFNARVQGLYRLGRSDPKRLAAVGGILMVASLLLAMANDGEDWYEELPDWDKDTYWHFKIGGEHFRIPKPFEIGVLFATIPERIGRAIKGLDRGEKTASRLWANVRDQLAFDPVPQLFRPGLDLWANWDSFRDKPIETQRDEGKMPSARYDQRTSATARVAVEAVAPVADAIGLSPKGLEYLVNGYFGTVGGYALGLSDMAVKRLQDAPESPALRVDDRPIVRSFYRVDPARATVYESDLYKLARELDQLDKSVKALTKDDPERAMALREKHALKLMAAPVVKRATARLSAIRKNKDAIMSSRDMTPREKRQELDRLQQLQNEVARDAVTLPAVAEAF